MSTTTTTTTSSTRSSSAGGGVPGKGLILPLAAVASILLPTLDYWFSDHTCKAKLARVQNDLRAKTHLWAYMEPDQADFSGQPEAGVVACDCVNDKLILTGRVVSDNIRQEFSDTASTVLGGARLVDNQIEVLNEGALRQLQAVLAAPPNDMVMNYQIKERGTVVLTGELPDPVLGEEIGKMVAGISGVRSVVNDLGRQLEVPKPLMVKNIYFDFNKWTIRKQSEVRLDEVAQYLTDYFGKRPQGRVRIEGHTDSIASDKYNIWLSGKRAKAVKDALVARGLDGGRLEPIGMGEKDLLIKPDDTPEKRAENRRIEFHFE